MTASFETDLPTTDPTRHADAAKLSAASRTATSDVGAEHEKLRNARVSTIIAAHPEALRVLIEGGFPLLAQAPLRWAMAHTVNLGQAFRIAGLHEEQQQALLVALIKLDVPANLDSANDSGAPGRH